MHEKMNFGAKIKSGHFANIVKVTKKVIKTRQAENNGCQNVAK